MIGPEGNAHRWTAPRPLPEAWSSGCATSRSLHFLYHCTSDPFPQLTKLLSKLRPMPYNAPLQVHTMPFTPTYYVSVPCVELKLTWLGLTPSASRAALELPPARMRSANFLRRFSQLESMTLLLSLIPAPSGRRNFLHLLRPVALRMRSL